MTDFLLELRCEEIPARMQLKASEDLARLFTEKLAEAGLTAGAIESFVTPRRLALIARDLPLETQPVSEERKGPRANAPEQALAGFLRSTGLTREQLVERDGILFAVIEKPGRATADVLAEAIPAIIRAFPWPKSMRWGPASHTTESLRWVRPLQGIVAILGDKLVDVEVDGIRAGFATLGHRFHHPGEITIGGAGDYAGKLRACHVVVSHQERQAIIAAKAREAAASKGYALIEDAGLVAENAGLTEWPIPLIGNFDSIFLEVPPEVIQLTLKTNQKYFVLSGSEGKLAPAFICTANIEAKDGGKEIIDGNRKVLAARLSDARFFWEQDRKASLADHATKLERITFHEKLGSVADKAARVAKLAEWLATNWIVPNCDPVLARQAAELCKADLVSEMVGEFPELQGVMGGYYARAEGLPDAVADAIRDHYKPVGQGDEAPTAPVSVAVSLADKLDTLVGFYTAVAKPSGSKDPYALRRAAVAIITILTDMDIHVSIKDLIEKASLIWLESLLSAAVSEDAAVEGLLNLAFEAQQKSVESVAAKIKASVDSTGLKLTLAVNARAQALLMSALDLGSSDNPDRVGLLTFFADRLKVQQREAGIRHDLIDAVFALGGEDDLVRLLARVKALQSFIATEDGVNLLAGYRRAANILKKEGFEAGEPKAITYNAEPAEAELATALYAAELGATDAVYAEDFEGAMFALATLRAPIDAFFDKVTVNDADPVKREARLGLLSRIRAAVHRVADFSRVEG